MEFNTSFNNRNPTFVPGPVQTEDETTNNQSENFTFDISDNLITYVTQTPDVTTVVTTNVDEGTSETDIYLTSSVRDDQLVTGNSTLEITEIKVMNKTVKVIISYTNLSHWHYSIDGGEEMEVVSGYAAIFNVQEYKTYTLCIKGVHITHKTKIKKITSFITIEPSGANSDNTTIYTNPTIITSTTY
ncbi:MAG: hypothetical protein CXT73_07535 [Methanobacteriota archaeon]|nr:MAG: hypothetical protein CXT73_07535 [Euryarchaeota archaeon]